MYKEARKKAGLSIEEAAYRLNIAPRTLCKYESGELNVPPDMALKMSQIYGMPELAPWHCAKRCAIGRVFCPVFQMGDLATDTLRLMRELRDVNERIGDLVDIAADGEVESNELSAFQDVVKELSELGEAIEKIKLLATKLTARGARGGAKAGAEARPRLRLVKGGEWSGPDEAA